MFLQQIKPQKNMERLKKVLRSIGIFLKFMGSILKQYFIWLMTIPVNFIPVAAMHKLDIYSNMSRIATFVEWIKSVVSDKDFLFVCIATLWALYVGMHFLKLSGEMARKLNKVADIVTICTFSVLLCGYILVCSNSWWMEFYKWLNPLMFNIVICITTCIIGFVSILLSAIESYSI